MSWRSDGAGAPTLFADTCQCTAALSHRSGAFAMATPRSLSAAPAAFSVIVFDITTSPVDERGACTSRATTHAQLNAEIAASMLYRVYLRARASMLYIALESPQWAGYESACLQVMLDQAWKSHQKFSMLESQCGQVVQGIHCINTCLRHVSITP